MKNKTYTLNTVLAVVFGLMLLTMVLVRAPHLSCDRAVQR